MACGRTRLASFFCADVSVFSAVFDRAQNASMHRLHEAQRTGQIKGFLFPYLGQQDRQLPNPPADLVRREEAHAYPTEFQRDAGGVDRVASACAASNSPYALRGPTFLISSTDSLALKELAMRIDIFNVGHGQCAVITAPNGRRMMLDCGDRWGDDRFWTPSLHFFRETIDLLGLMNLDEDHLRDFKNMMQDCTVPWILSNPTVGPREYAVLKKDGMGPGAEAVAACLTALL